MACYRYLRLDERQRIQRMWEAGNTVKEIAEQLKVPLSTMYAEIKRGQDQKPASRTSGSSMTLNWPSSRCNGPLSGGAGKLPGHSPAHSTTLLASGVRDHKISGETNQ